MKSKLLMLSLFIKTSMSHAQTVDEIVDSYIETIGGKSFLRNLEGIKMTGSIKQSNFDIPFDHVLLKDGRQYFEITFSGSKIKQNVYDGRVLWSINLSTNKVQISDNETTENLKLATNDFPDVLLDYKQKNYVIDLMGEVETDGRKA